MEGGGHPRARMLAVVAAALVWSSLATKQDAKPPMGKYESSTGHSRRLEGSDFLSTSLCELRDANASYAMGFEMNVADDMLVPYIFEKSVPGIAVLAMDEGRADSWGGGVNPEGSYFTYLLDSSVLGEGACDITKPTDGSKLCFPSADGTKNWTAVFMLGEGDAIAFMGCTPPPVSYFGYDVDIQYMLHDYPETVYAPGENFADTVNMIRVHTATGTPFDSPVLVVHTADDAAARSITDAYSRLGIIPEEAVNVHKLPPASMGPVRFFNRSSDWRETAPSVLTAILRASQPQVPEHYETFKAMFWPVRYYFSKDPASVAESPYDDYEYIKRDNGFDEQAAFAGKLRDLVKTVRAKLDSELGGIAKFQSTQGNWTAEGFYDDWDKFLADVTPDMTPLIPTRDATYNVGPAYGTPVGPATGLAAVGIMHTREDILGTLYQEVMIDVYRGDMQKLEFFQFWNQTRLEGSADMFFDGTGDEDDARNFFVVLALPGDGCERMGLAGKLNCVPLASLRVGGTFSAGSYPLVGERVYCAKDTGIGPGAVTGLPAHILSFETAYAEQ
mmetsp:Transcript_12529/g.37681  ORF Transcript_12529/g.37681 Transcript_12529/m.37681 type:complete len:559 (-) Transcript_12529:1508-3184(-)